MKKRYFIISIVLVFALVLIYALYWKLPSGRETMRWARSFKEDEVKTIELVIQPSSEESGNRMLSGEDLAEAVELINQSAGRYIAEPESLAGLSRTLIVTMEDGSCHEVTYAGYLWIDGEAFADRPGGYSEDGARLDD